MATKSDRSGLEPTALALTLCEEVYEDPRTGRFTIIGTFFRVSISRFPAIFPFCVYACLTDGRGRTTVRVRLVDVDDARVPVWDGQFDLDFTEPNLVLEFGIDISDARFAHPGIYRLQLIAENATIMERSIYVDRAIKPEEN